MKSSSNLLKYKGLLAFSMLFMTFHVWGDVIDWDLLSSLPATREQLSTHDRMAASHRLRLVSGVQNLLSNPRFLAEHPEYRPLADQILKVIEVTSEHDYNKNNMAKRSTTIQTLAKADSIGVDWRSLEPDNRFRKAMVEAVHDLNAADDAHWKKALSSKFKNPIHRKLLTDLVMAIDWYDVPFARKSDFGSLRQGHLKRPIESAGSWVTNHQKELNLSSDSVKRMTSITEFVDREVDYKSIASRYNQESLRHKGFAAHLREIKRNVKLNSGHFFSRARLKAQPKMGATLAMSSILVHGASFAYDPSSVEPGDVVANFATGFLGGLNQTADCDTPNCSRLFAECREKNLNDSECAQMFFSYPLPKQSKLRQEAELDKRLSSIVGRVDELKCDGGAVADNLTARIQFRTPGGGTYHQIINYDQNWRVLSSKVRNLSESSSKHHLINYNSQSQAVQVEVFAPSQNQFKSLPPGELTEYVEHLYESYPAEINTGLKSTIQGHRIVRVLGSQIYNCCLSSKCIAEMNQIRDHSFESKATYIKPISGLK